MNHGGASRHVYSPRASSLFGQVSRARAAEPQPRAGEAGEKNSGTFKTKESRAGVARVPFFESPTV